MINPDNRQWEKIESNFFIAIFATELAICVQVVWSINSYQSKSNNDVDRIMQGQVSSLETQVDDDNGAQLSEDSIDGDQDSAGYNQQ